MSRCFLVQMTSSLSWSLFLAAMSLAQTGQSLVYGQGAAPGPDQMFQSLDTNDDDQLSLSDVQGNNRAILEDILKMSGKPTSGTVTRKEFDKVYEEHQARARGGNRPPNTGRPPTPPPTTNAPPVNENSDGSLSEVLLKLCDTDGDGRLTRAEWNRLPSMWVRLDTNSDGVLDDAERAAFGRTSPANVGGTATPPPTTRPRPGSTTPATNPPVAAPAVAGLNGVWRGWVVQGTGENPNEGEMEIELTITGTKIDGKELSTRRSPPGGLGSGSYTMTGNAKSGNLDSEQTAGQNAGRTYMGVYEVTGDTLKWCVTGRGRTRPATMATDKGNYLLILRKQP